MARTTKDADAVLTFRLPRELHQRLVDAVGGRGVSEEMRHRLEKSFEPDPLDEADPKTRQLLVAISEIAATLNAVHGSWYEKPWSFAVLRTAIDTLLTMIAPEGEPVFDPSEKTLTKVVWETTDVGSVGQTLALSKVVDLLA